MDMVQCSKEVYDVLTAFNNLPSLSEQEEVLDLIYDALYKRNYKAVLENQVIQSLRQDNHKLEDTRRELKKDLIDAKHKIDNLQGQIKTFESGRKGKLRSVIRELLIIINNVKHYLGEGWDTIFPNGVEDVEAFLKEVDTQKILEMDTWSKYEMMAAEESDNSPEEETF
ncbi:MAG: hypothetical protein MJZ17_08385 [Bacteroidales bacterium]|nr:hypothetical protein [Bacteroidales bacterium]